MTAARQSPLPYPVSNIPVPDPSLLTTDQLRREIYGLRELLEARVLSIDDQIKHMRELSIERMSSRALQFQESDLRYQQRYDSQQRAITDALAAAEKAVAAALANADRAVNKAEVAAEKRFESVNEFRAQLTDQTATLLTRAEADAKLSALSDRISDIKGRIDIGDGGKQATVNNMTNTIAVSGLVTSIVVAAFVGMGLLIKPAAPPLRAADAAPYYAPSRTSETPAVVVAPAIVGAPRP